MVFTVVPVAVILSISMQTVDVLTTSRFSVVPDVRMDSAFTSISKTVGGNYSQSLLRSLWIALSTAIVSVVLSLVFHFYVTCNPTKKDLISRSLVTTLASLFFLPSFLLYFSFEPAVLGFSLPLSAYTQLFIASLLGTLPLTFFAIASVSNERNWRMFESLRLDLTDDASAYKLAYVVHNTETLTIAFAIALATSWAEFDLAGLLTAREVIKPFAVQLDMIRTQHMIDYSGFAGGTLVSFAVLAALSLFFWLCCKVYKRVNAP